MRIRCGGHLWAIIIALALVLINFASCTSKEQPSEDKVAIVNGSVISQEEFDRLKKEIISGSDPVSDVEAVDEPKEPKNPKVAKKKKGSILPTIITILTMISILAIGFKVRGEYNFYVLLIGVAVALIAYLILLKLLNSRLSKNRTRN